MPMFGEKHLNSNCEIHIPLSLHLVEPRCWRGSFRLGALSIKSRKTNLPTIRGKAKVAAIDSMPPGKLHSVGNLDKKWDAAASHLIPASDSGRSQ